MSSVTKRLGRWCGDSACYIQSHKADLTCSWMSAKCTNALMQVHSVELAVQCTWPRGPTLIHTRYKGNASVALLPSQSKKFITAGEAVSVS